MVSVLDSGSSSLDSSADWGHCVVFLGKTLSYSHIALAGVIVLCSRSAELST